MTFIVTDEQKKKIERETKHMLDIQNECKKTNLGGGNGVELSPPSLVAFAGAERRLTLASSSSGSKSLKSVEPPRLGLFSTCKDSLVLKCAGLGGKPSYLVGPWLQKKKKKKKKKNARNNKMEQQQNGTTQY